MRASTCFPWIPPLLIVAAIGIVAACKPRDSHPATQSAVEVSAAEARIREAASRFSNASSHPRQPTDPRLSGIGKLLNAGRFEEARVALEPIVVASPGTLKARLYLGLALHKLKRYAEARPHFEAVLDGHPDFEKAEGAFHFYGWCLYYLGEPEAARAAFEAYLRFHPDDHDSWFAVGVCDLEAQRLDEASMRFERSIALGERAGSPQAVARAHARLADVRLAENDVANARKELETSVRIFPGHGEAWHKLARVCARQNDARRADEAQREFERRRNE